MLVANLERNVVFQSLVGTVIPKPSVGVFLLDSEQHFSAHDPAISPLSPSLWIVSVAAFEACIPSISAGPGSRPVLGYGSGLCLPTNEAEDHLYS